MCACCTCETLCLSVLGFGWAVTARAHIYICAHTRTYAHIRANTRTYAHIGVAGAGCEPGLQGDEEHCSHYLDPPAPHEQGWLVLVNVSITHINPCARVAVCVHLFLDTCNLLDTYRSRIVAPLREKQIS